MAASRPSVEQLLTESAIPTEPSRLRAVRRRLFHHGNHRLPEHYELHEELGRGRFGRVFRATDAKFKREVALKLIDHQSKAELARIEREAHGLARLSHPNVVHVYDKGIADDGTYFLAMELVDGPRLDEWLELKERSLREIIDVFAQAAEGLHHAHSRGLIHRDFKPSNVLVDTAGRVRILDFGLVKQASASEVAGAKPAVEDEELAEPAVDHDVSGSGGAEIDEDDRRTLLDPDLPGPEVATRSIDEEAELTEVGAFVGTPHYAAPEQLTGAVTDPRSDQFSFFVALFEAVHGYRPFSGRTIVERVQRISGRDLATGRSPRRVPRWLRKLLHRGLSPEPAERFDDMEEIARALRRHLSSNLRTRFTFAAAGVVAGALLITTSMFVMTPTIDLDWEGAWPPSMGPSDVETVHGTALREALEDYEHRWESALAEYEQRPEREADSAAVQCLRAGKQRFREFLERLDEPPAPSMDARWSVSAERMWLAQLFAPEDCLGSEPKWEVDESIVTLLLDAEADRIRGDYVAARDKLEQARTLVPHDLSKRSGLIDYKLGTAQLLMGDARAWWTLADAEASNERDSQFLADVLTRRVEAGVFLGSVGVEPLQALLLRLERRVDETNRGSLLMAQAHVAFLRGETSGAKDLYRSARETFEARPDADRLAFLIDYCRLHEAFMESWNETPVVDLDEVEQAFSRMTSRLGDEHPSTFRYTIKVARVFENTGDLERARKMLVNGLAQFEGPRAHDAHMQFDLVRAKVEILHLDIGLALREGSVSRTLKDRWLERAISIEEDAFSEQVPGMLYADVHRVRELLVEAYGRVGDLDRAVGVLDEMERASRLPHERQDVCYYAAPFETFKEYMTESNAALLTRILESCGVRDEDG